MTLTLTSLYALPLAVLALILWFNVSRTRAATHVSIGDGGDVALHQHIRRHGNFIETVPMTLILMALAEVQGVAPLWLHAAGVLLLLGRLVHPFGLRADNAAHPLRIVGNTAGLMALLILMGTLAAKLLA